VADRVVPREDISDIRRAMKELRPEVRAVKEQVSLVDDKVAKSHKDLELLRKAFNDYIQQDAKDKQLQLAQTRIVTVRQERKQKFGLYDALRQRATGILQASDLSMVRRNSIRNTTDDMMMSAPKYWLAPVIVATSSWLLDNQELANKAVAEALKRDDEKASLFFALLMRRGKRSQSYPVWLDRYFGMQDPEVLDRQMMVVLNALVNGVFGPETYKKCLDRVNDWVEELEEKAGYADRQRQRWETALRSKIGFLGDDIYPYLQKNSPTWDRLSERLREAKGHEDIYQYFNDVFEGEITPLSKFEDEVDSLLNSLASEYDDEELPYDRDERLYQLIIDYDGDRPKAKQKFDETKSAYEDKLSFTDILSNAAISPELTGTSRATQRFAIAQSHDWITGAHQDFTAKNRMTVPQSIELEIDDWKGASTDGSNEVQLANDVKQHYEKQKQDALAKIKITPFVWGCVAVGGLIGVPSLFSGNFPGAIVGAGGGGAAYGIGKKQSEEKKRKVESAYEKKTSNTHQILRASLAEVVDWRREYAECDQNEAKVTELFEGITPEQYILNPHGSSRKVM